MARYILGIHSGHNSSVCIGDDRRILFAIQEERLTGEKNYWGFPARSIKACLDAVGATPSDLVAVAHGSRQVISGYRTRDDLMASYRRAGTAYGKLRQRVLVPMALRLVPNLRQGDLEAPLAEAGLGDVPRRARGAGEAGPAR